MTDAPDPPGDLLKGLSTLDALDAIAILVDKANDDIDTALADYALELAEQLQKRELEPVEGVLLDYFRANAWACLYKKRVAARENLWAFEQPEVFQQILLLRKSVYAHAFAQLPAIRQCQILTNLANQLDAIGRFIEARAYWSRALRVDPNFWMASANRGRGLMFYASALYDPGHVSVFAHQAHHDLMEALASLETHPHLGDPSLSGFFTDAAARIAEHHDVASIRMRLAQGDWPLGATSIEISYRSWCLENTLFLNPLNDATSDSIAARDVLVLPSFTTRVGEPPIIVGMYNELKQLYASARWLLWAGIQGDEPHFSDRDVLLLNTLDYPAHGLRIEQVKAAFRMSCSVFDKVAYFLNFYLALQIPMHQVSFRSIWKAKPGQPVRAILDGSQNWPLRGLYWVSKDLFEADSRGAAEPEARDLADLRNHLEHKHVVVHDMFAADTPSVLPTPGHPYRLGREALERKTLRLLQLARSALVYLSLAVHHEERRRDAGRAGLVAPMDLDEWLDEWKH